MESTARSLMGGGGLLVTALFCLSLTAAPAQPRHARGSWGWVPGRALPLIPGRGIGTKLGRQALASQLAADAGPSSGPGLQGGRRVLQADPAGSFLNVSVGGYTGVTWRGWGTSLAWFANFMGGLPPAQQAQLLDLLFSKTSGLGLDIVRYIIPGGLDPAKSKVLATLPFNAAPGFRSGPAAPYNWSADAPQRAVLFGALARGAVAEAVSYSPPSWMTISGDVTGNRRGAQNIAPARLPEFVAYLADVVEHFQEAWNVTFVGLAPFNEPLSPWWDGGNNQEGCAFDVPSISTVLQALRVEMQARGLNGTALVGLEEWVAKNSGTSAATQRAFQQLPALWSQLDRVGIHAYRVPSFIKPVNDSQIQIFSDFANVTRQQGKELHVTEWGPWRPKPGNPGDLDLALAQARIVAELVNYGGAWAFVHWQAIVPTGPYNPTPYCPNVGLIRMAFNYSAAFAPRITKQYYVQMHFSRHVPPGSNILQISGGSQRFALVAYNPASKQLSVTAVNQEEQDMTLSLAFAGQVKVSSATRAGLTSTVYRTSARESYKLLLTKKRIAPNRLPHITLPAQSLTTMVLSNAIVKW